MTPDGRDDFFVGWEAKAPAALARLAGRVAAAAIAVAAGVAILAAASVAPVPDGLHEYGHLRTFEGAVLGATVVVLVPGEGEPALLLAGVGKHGPPPEIVRLQGRRIRFRGTLIRRDLAMAEVTEPASLEDLGPASEVPSDVRIGEVELTGELVDTKCWLGVMRPATGKVHRACAVRCLSGGVPPGLLVRRDDGSLETVVLEAAGGGALAISPELAARVLTVRGTLALRAGVPVLRVAEWALSDASALKKGEPA